MFKHIQKLSLRDTYFWRHHLCWYGHGILDACSIMYWAVWKL